MTKYTQGLQAPPANFVCFRHVVPEEGLEPSLLTEHDFESCASTIPPLRQVMTV